MSTRERWAHQDFLHLLAPSPKSPTMAGAELAQSQEATVQSESPAPLAGTQPLDLLASPPRNYTSRKLEPDVRAGS